MTLHVPQDNSPLESQVVGAGANADVDSVDDVVTGEEDGLAEDIELLSGTNPDQTAYIDVSAVDRLEDITSTDEYQLDTDVLQEREEGDAEDFDTLIELELRDGETGDVMEAVQEGFTYVPPIDPPITTDTDDPEGVEVATGFGLTADPDDLSIDSVESMRTDDDAMTALVRRALRDDSRTQHLASRLYIATVNGSVIVRGEVDDLIDSDSLLEVIGDVPGVEDVRDETTVRGL
jgi:hypothetical protein